MRPRAASLRRRKSGGSRLRDRFPPLDVSLSRRVASSSIAWLDNREGSRSPLIRYYRCIRLSCDVDRLVRDVPPSRHRSAAWSSRQENPRGIGQKLGRLQRKAKKYNWSSASGYLVQPQALDLR